VCRTLWAKSHTIAFGSKEGVLSFEVSHDLGTPRRRWVDNIKIDLGEIGWDGMNWIDVTQDRDQWRDLVNTVMNFRVP
jgi:hypothetical protein